MKFNILQYLEDTVREVPNKIAFADEVRSLTFNGLRNEALLVANCVFEYGKKNRPVAVIMPKSCFSLVSFFGALYSGNFYTPIDHKYPRDRLRAVLKDLSPEIIIVDNQSMKVVSELGLSEMRVISIEDILSTSMKFSDQFFLSLIGKKIDTDPVYCIYTSGSTGTPKGVVIPHKAVIDYLENTIPIFGITKATTIGNQAQFHFDLSVLDVFAPLKTGCTTVIIPDHFFSFTSKLIPFLLNFNVNFLCWAPAVLNYLSSVDILANTANLRFHHIVFCGEALPVKALNYWRKHLPTTVFINLYGPTETTLSSMHYVIERDFEDSENLPIGKADQNTDIFLLQPENGVGEICIRGSSLALGYWNDFIKTNEKFIQNPSNSSYLERVYLTGDIARLNSNGEYEYVGRKDNQIKHMGYRIELEEIERAVEMIEGVKSSYVFYDQANKEIICSLALSDEDFLDSHIRKSLKEYLPSYMLPTKILRFKDLPLNTRGKIDRNKIKETYYGKN